MRQGWSFLLIALIEFGHGLEIGRDGRGTLIATNSYIHSGYHQWVAKDTGSRGYLSLRDSTNVTDSGLYIALQVDSTGTIVMANSQLDVSNSGSDMYVGYNGYGSLMATDSVLNCYNVIVGQTDQGELRLVNSDLYYDNRMDNANVAGSTGLVMVLDGSRIFQTDPANGPVLGWSGHSINVISNSYWENEGPTFLAWGGGCRGDLELYGATNIIKKDMYVAYSSGATGIVSLAEGSVWDVNGHLAFAYAGDAVLQADESHVNIGSNLFINASSSWVLTKVL